MFDVTDPKLFFCRNHATPFLKLMWIIHILHCTTPRYVFAIDSKCSIVVTHFNTALIKVWVFTKFLLLKISTKHLSQFLQTKREGHKIISNHSAGMLHTIRHLHLITENIQSPLRFTSTINYREDTLLCIDDLYNALYTQIVFKTPTALKPD